VASWNGSLIGSDRASTGSMKHSMKSMLNAANIRGPKFDGASAQRWLLAHGHLLKPVRSR